MAKDVESGQQHDRKLAQIGLRVPTELYDRFYRNHRESGMPLSCMLVKMLELFEHDPAVAELKRTHGEWLKMMEKVGGNVEQNGRGAKGRAKRRSPPRVVEASQSA